MRIGGRDKRVSDKDVFHISDAPKPLSQDIRSRESKYLMAMGIRIVAFLLIVILPIAWPWKLGLAAMALVLPYVAVVYANGGREPTRGADMPYQAADQRELTRGEPEADESGPREPLLGTIVGDDAPRAPGSDPGHTSET
jgi:hypothetical protein